MPRRQTTGVGFRGQALLLPSIKGGKTKEVCPPFIISNP